RNILMTFVSLQAVRIPAFRKVLRDSTAKLHQVLLQTYARSKETLKRLVEKAQKKSGKDMSDVPIEQLQEFLLDEQRYTVVAEDSDYFLGQQFELQDGIFHAIYPKVPLLLRCDSESSITSDHPVLQIRNPDIPPLYS